EEGDLAAQHLRRAVHDLVDEAGDAERGDVDEDAALLLVTRGGVLEQADVDRPPLAGLEDRGGAGDVVGDAGGLAEVAAGAERDDPERGVGLDGLAAVEEAVGDLVRGAVAADGDDGLRAGRERLARDARRVARRGRAPGVERADLAGEDLLDLVPAPPQR